jgi:FtsZ-binding cell division protein ZapB
MKRICDQQQAKLEELEQRIKDNQKSYQDKIKGLVASISKLEG